MNKCIKVDIDTKILILAAIWCMSLFSFDYNNSFKDSILLLCVVLIPMYIIALAIKEDKIKLN